jgi:hypothetical protein
MQCIFLEAVFINVFINYKRYSMDFIEQICIKMKRHKKNEFKR